MGHVSRRSGTMMARNKSHAVESDRSMRLPILEKMPSRAPGHVFHFVPAQRRERADRAIQYGQRLAGRNIAPGESARSRASVPNWLTMRSRSLDRLSRTCAAARAGRAQSSSSGCRSAALRKSAKESPVRNRAIDRDVPAGRPSKAGNAASSRQSCSFISESHSALPEVPDSPVSRTRMQRRTRARCSQRSAYRPSQKM